MKREASQQEQRLLFRPGEEVGPYQVLRLLGRGGMGEVHLALDLRLGRKVALKVIHAGRIGSEQWQKRFQFEARATAQFSHPHIVTVYGVGEHEGHPYVALEYLDGENLRHRMQKEDIGIQEALRIAWAVVQALEEAHEHQLLHRDLKPENVFLPKDGRIRVLDFGLAKRLQDDEHSEDFDWEQALALHSEELRSEEGQETPELQQQFGEAETMDLSELKERMPSMAQMLTSHGHELRGTPAYMSPEQWNHQPCTAATDVWALGVLLFELLAKERPFGGANHLELAAEICYGEAPRLEQYRDLPKALADAVAQCLHKEPDERPRLPQLRELLESHLFRRRLSLSEEESPFRGLYPFSERHADFFFGREREIASFLERLRDTPILPVVGASGAGKSSFVQAGVLPRLREQGTWEVLSMRPGAQPFQMLAARLLSGETTEGHLSQSWRATQASTPSLNSSSGRVLDQEEAKQSLAQELQQTPSLLALWLRKHAQHHGGKVLLLIDQLEELYTLVESEELRRRFMQALCEAANDPQDPFRILFTLRDDFLGRLAQTPEAREALSRVVILGPPTEEALLEIIEVPLGLLGYDFDDATLARQIVDGIKREPACLPLLQFSAQMLWERRDHDNKLLLRSAYRAMGGVEGALATHADGVLNTLSPAQHELARELFLRLVTAENTRKVVSDVALLSGLPKDARAVLEKLVQARLLSVRKGQAHEEGAVQFELVHESLLSTWRRLARWIDESREERVFLAELEQAVRLWQKRGCREEEAWQGEALQEAQRMRGRIQIPLPPLFDQFLEAGRRGELRREGRWQLVRRVMLGLSSLVVLAVMVGFWQVTKERDRAQKRQQEALYERGQARQRLADALAESARVSFLTKDIRAARSKLRSSLELSDSSVLRTLWRRLKLQSLRWKQHLSGAIYHIDYDPKGQWIAVASQNGLVHLFHPKTAEVKHLRGHTSQVYCLAFSPDGRYFASSSRAGELFLWSLSELRYQALPGHRGQSYALAFHPTLPLLAAASVTHGVEVWDLKRRKLRWVFPHGHRILALRFHPRLPLLLAGGRGRGLLLLDWKRKQLKSRAPGHQSAVLQIAYDDKKRRWLSFSADGLLHSWSEDLRRNTALALPHPKRLETASFSRDLRLLATAGRDRKLRVWDWQTQRLLKEIDGRFVKPRSVVFSPSGKHLIAGGWGSFLKSIAWRRHRKKKRYKGHFAPGNDLAFHPKAPKVVSVSWDHTARIWGLFDGHSTRLVRHRRGIYTVDIRPDGEALALGTWDGQVQLWRWDAQQPWRTLALKQPISRLRYTADGKYLFGSTTKGGLYQWDATTGAQLRRFEGHSKAIYGFAFHPTASVLATAGADKAVKLWDISTGQKLLTLKTRATLRDVLFSRDGSKLYYCGEGNAIVEVDRETEGRRRIGRHRDTIYRLALHPKGRLLASASADKTVKVWDLKTGKVKVLYGHLKEANAVRFRNDGSVLASTGDDRSVRMWRTRDWMPLWRAPFLHPKSLQLATDRGWFQLHPGTRSMSPVKAKARWQQKLRRDAIEAQLSPGGQRLCLRTPRHGLELWDLPSDRLELARSFPSIRGLIALDAGCVIWTQGRLLLLKASGQATPLLSGVTQLTAGQQGRWYALKGDRIHSYDKDATPGPVYPGEDGIRRVLRYKSWLLVGFFNGVVKLLPTQKGQRAPKLFFARRPSSAVLRMALGPMDTLFAAFTNGVVFHWSLHNGALLYVGHLHGRAQHFARSSQHFVSVSEHGNFLAWDLSMFSKAYCALLDEVWSQVPTIWKNRKILLQEPPSKHPCLQSNAKP